MTDLADRVNTDESSPAPRPKLWTGTYILVCAGAFLAYSNYALLSPTLPLFIDSLSGSSQMVGYALAAFSVVSFLVRPFIGRLADTWSTRGVFGFGALLVGVGSLAYLMPTLPAVFAGRMVQGAGWAGLNTGANTMAATLAPPERRGEASGYFQTAMMVAVGFLPAIALWLLGFTSFSLVFLLASIAGILSAAITTIIRSTRRPAPVARNERLLESLYERGALLPSALLLLQNLPYPAAIFFLPLYARDIGVVEVAALFLVQGVVIVATQSGLGRLSDRIGRAPTIAAGLALAALGLVMLSQAAGFALLVVAGAIYVFGNSIAGPAILALVMDRANPAKLGAAMATYSLSFQIGNAGGALATGLLVALVGYRSMYLVTVLPLLVGLIITWMTRASRPKAAVAMSQ
jgi:MFS family permease